jgi:peptide chain release factor
LETIWLNNINVASTNAGACKSKQNVVLSISSGNGPEECAYAAACTMQVILKEAKGKLLNTAVLETEVSHYNDGNILSCLLAIEGEGAEEFGLSWAGTIQWVWQSKYRPHHKRKNWFVAVSMLSVPKNSAAFSQRDVRYETARASGPGGQNVNKTETMVRAVHIPTGKSVVCRDERSQLMNKKLALAKLAALFADEAESQKQNLEKDLRHKHYELERGNPIRIYDGETLSPINVRSPHASGR